MKKFSFIGITLLVILLISSCGTPEPQAISFDYWTSQTQSDRMATIQVLIDTYTTLNPEVSINLIAVDENDLPTQLSASAAAGSLPAMVELGAENAVAFGAEGFFDISANTALINEIGKDKFYDGVLRLLSTGGGDYYGVPLHGWVQGIWYRADWFEQAGLEPPSTWENILKAAQYFNDPANNQYGILIGTDSQAYSEQTFTQFALSNNAGLFDKDGNLIFNSPEMKEAVEYYAQLAQYTPPGPQYWRGRDYYLQGKMAMFFYSTYIMDDLALEETAAGSLTSENFEDLQGAGFDPELVANTKLAPIISNKSPAGYGVVEAVALTNQEDDAVTAAATQFIKYIYSPNAYITYLHMSPGGMNPVIKEIATNERFQNDPNGIFKNYGPDKMAEIISGMNEIETFSIVDGNRIEAASTIFANQIIPQMIYAITQEGVDIDTAMAAAEEAMKEISNN